MIKRYIEIWKIRSEKNLKSAVKFRKRTRCWHPKVPKKENEAVWKPMKPMNHLKYYPRIRSYALIEVDEEDWRKKCGKSCRSTLICRFLRWHGEGEKNWSDRKRGKGNGEEKRVFLKTTQGQRLIDSIPFMLLLLSRIGCWVKVELWEKWPKMSHRQFIWWFIWQSFFYLFSFPLLRILE